MIIPRSVSEPGLEPTLSESQPFLPPPASPPVPGVEARSPECPSLCVVSMVCGVHITVPHDIQCHGYLSEE